MLAQKVLEEGNTLYAAGAAAGVDLAEARGLGLLTTKPFIYVFNLDEDQLADADAARLAARARGSGRLGVPQRQARGRPDGDGARRGHGDAGVLRCRRSPGSPSWLAPGSTPSACRPTSRPVPKESRAWTIGQGWTAPQAAGVIHTDFQRGFIKAEIVSFEDLDSTGSMAAAKAAGKVRIEGKDYVMSDGDVVEFRFNV